MQAPEEHPDLLLDAADGVVDIFLSSVNKAEVADVLDRAVKMSSTKVIVVIVNGDAPDVKWEAPEDWSCIQQEVLWAQWTRFDATSQLWLLARTKGESQQLHKLFDSVLEQMKSRNHVVPGRSFPFSPYAGMAIVDEEIPHVRRGSEISFYVQAAKKQRTTFQVPVPRLSERVLTSGPWPGIREMAPQDFLQLYGYQGDMCNISLLVPAMQKKFLVKRVPVKVGELMWRWAVHARNSLFQ